MSNDSQILPYKNQVWENLKVQYNNCQLFEDPEFQAIDQSIYFSKSVPAGVTWKRPKEIMQNPQFCVDHFDRADMDQGQLGNCWFIAASAGILQVPNCFAKVVPNDQGYDENYGGIFHFRFWQYGDWLDVVIDDRLPFISNKRLLFCSNKQMPNELWGPLLEKAYAKLYGSYECLNGGVTTDALIDMTGGIGENFDLKQLNTNAQHDLWYILLKSYNKNSIIGCSINPDPAVKEAKLTNGLVRGHAFTVTKVININIRGVDVSLIRCRNPWGNNIEWNGAWSDSSPEWQAISDEEKQELGLVVDADGEAWMQFSDFLTNWDNVQICHLSADSFSTELDDINHTWKCTSYKGSWVNGISAGGSGRGNPASFWTNPQFLIKLTEIDNEDHENLATVIISLMQKDARLKRRETKNKATDDFIQFRLYKIKNGVTVDEHISSGVKLYANQLDNKGSSGSYINKREVTGRFRVPLGEYLIIPSTYEPNHNGDFLLRVFTEGVVDNSALENHKIELHKKEVHVHDEHLHKVILNNVHSILHHSEHHTSQQSVISNHTSVKNPCCQM